MHEQTGGSNEPQNFIKMLGAKWNSSQSWGNDYKDIPAKSGVYVFVSFNIETHEREIVYIGSSTNLMLRYKSHKIPELIREEGLTFTHHFKVMKKGFYDYEMNLIRKFNPRFNKIKYAR